MERKDGDDWVLACRSCDVNGIRDGDIGKTTGDECVKKNLVTLGVCIKNGLWIELSGGVSYAETIHGPNMDNGR